MCEADWEFRSALGQSHCSLAPTDESETKSPSPSWADKAGAAEHLDAVSKVEDLSFAASLIAKHSGAAALLRRAGALWRWPSSEKIKQVSKRHHPDPSTADRQPSQKTHHHAGKAAPPPHPCWKAVIGKA